MYKTFHLAFPALGIEPRLSRIIGNCSSHWAIPVRSSTLDRVYLHRAQSLETFVKVYQSQHHCWQLKYVLEKYFVKTVIKKKIFLSSERWCKGEAEARGISICRPGPGLQNETLSQNTRGFHGQEGHAPESQHLGCGSRKIRGSGSA